MVADHAGKGRTFDWIEDSDMWCFETALPDDLSESPIRLSRADTTYAKGEQVLASGIMDACGRRWRKCRPLSLARRDR